MLKQLVYTITTEFETCSQYL